MLNAGAAVLDITPPLGTPLAGSFNARYATGIDDPLNARAVVLEDEQGPAGRIAIVCCDLICMPDDIVRAARQLVAEGGDVPADRVLIAATHTHTAASPTGLLGTPRADSYMEALPARLATVIRMAASRLRPARAAWGAGNETGVSFNRRFRMRDGTVRMNPGRRNPDIVQPVGPIDPELGVLWIEHQDGRPLASVACFALHYVGTDNSRHVSADYFGRYAGWMQRVYGSDYVPLLLNGTSGDVNNVDVRDARQLSGAHQAHRVAGILAGETVRVVERLRASSEVSLAARSERFRFERKRITPEDVAVASRLIELPEDTPPAELRQRAGIGPSGPFSWVVGQPLPADRLVCYARECLALDRLPVEQETEIQALRIGTCALVGLPGEIFVELGLAIKQQSPFAPRRRPATGEATSLQLPALGEAAPLQPPAPGEATSLQPPAPGEATSLQPPAPGEVAPLQPPPGGGRLEGGREAARSERSSEGALTMVASLANGYIGYVPTRRAQLEEGGYETWAARSALPAAGTGEAMVETALKLLRKLA